MFHQYYTQALWVLQAVAGVIFIVHGWPKFRKPEGFASALGVPKFAGMLQGIVEIAGGILLIANLYVFWVSLVFAIIMLGAIYFKIFKWKSAFWSHTGTGWEFDLLLLAVFIMLITK